MGSYWTDFRPISVLDLVIGPRNFTCHVIFATLNLVFKSRNCKIKAMQNLLPIRHHIYDDAATAFLRLSRWEQWLLLIPLVETFMTVTCNRRRACGSINDATKIPRRVSYWGTSHQQLIHCFNIQKVWLSLLDTVSFCACNANYCKLGWKISENVKLLVWTNLPEASKACQELLRCGWKSERGYT